LYQEFVLFKLHFQLFNQLRAWKPHLGASPYSTSCVGNVGY